MNTITKFYTDGCMNCKALGGILDRVKAENPSIKYLEVNTKDDKAAKYEITSLPTLVFEKDGQEVGRLVGLKPQSLITKKIQEVF